MQLRQLAACFRGLRLWWAARRTARHRLQLRALQSLVLAVSWGRLAVRDARLHRREHQLRGTLRAWHTQASLQVCVVAHVCVEGVCKGGGGLGWRLTW